MSWVLNVAVGRSAPRIMGVLNVTPDSFSDGGRHAGAALAHARALITDGAAIVDVGGESTRPGADPVPVDVERARVVPVIRALAGELVGDDSTVLSIDTYKAAVADEALRAGAKIVNDVSGGLLDPRLLEVVAAHGAVVILGHLRGTPATMAGLAEYGDVVAEVRDELGARVEAAKRAGIAADRIWIDPGLGFAKQTSHNLMLLANLDRLRLLGCPIVVGASRKRFLSEAANPRDGVPVAEREELTAAAHALAIWQGADVVRVHDVRRQAPTVWLAMKVAALRRAREMSE